MNTFIVARFKLAGDDFRDCVFQGTAHSQDHFNAHFGEHILGHWPGAASDDIVDAPLLEQARQLPGRAVPRTGDTLTPTDLAIFEVNKLVVLAPPEVSGDLFPITGYCVSHWLLEPFLSFAIAQP